MNITGSIARRLDQHPTSRRLRACCAAILATASLPTLASPAAADDNASWRVDEVVISASRTGGYAAEGSATLRTPVPIQEVPQSVQVLTRKLLDEQALYTLSDALANVSGVVPAKPMEAVLDQPEIRGFGAEIYIDGLPAFGLTAVIDPSSLIGVERIEVAKGPTSTLYGGGLGAPVGGLINVVTKTPGKEARRSLGLRAGSFGLIAPSLDIDQPIGENAGFRIAAEYQEGGDYIDAVETERLSINPSFRAALGADTDLLVRGQYSKIEQLEYAGLPAEVVGLPGVYSRRFSGATDAPPTEIENTLLTAVLSHRFNDTVSGTFQLRRYDSDFVENASFVFPAFYPPVGTNYALITAYLPTKVTAWTADASVTAQFDSGSAQHVVLAGFQYDRTHYDAGLGFNFFPIGIIDFADRGSDAPFGTRPGLSLVQDDRYTTIAAFIQDQVTVAERWHILASLRATRIKYEQLAGGTTNESYNKLSPRIGVTYDLSDGVSLFAGHAQGFRATINFTGAEPPIPETSRSLEAGLKFAMADHGLSGTVAVYELKRRNVPTPDPGNPFLQVQTGEQRSRGFEADLIWEPSPNWSVLASYAHTKAEVTEDNSIPVGDRLSRTPDDQGRVAVRYRFIGGALDGLGLGAGVSAASSAELTLPNSGFRSDSYAVVDAQASYRLGKVRLGLSLTNLFDKDYVLPYQYLALPIVSPGQPRTVQVTVGVDF